jgi:hypothetical protein
MAWEQGPRGRPFYTRTLRVGGRRVRQYLGSGLEAQAAAAADDLRRLGREIAARERHAEQARRREAEAPLLHLCELTDVLARAALVAAGYHRHDRGEWRRCRETERTG